MDQYESLRNLPLLTVLPVFGFIEDWKSRKDGTRLRIADHGATPGASGFRLTVERGRYLLLPSLALILAGGSKLLAPTFPAATVVGPVLSVVVLVVMVTAVGPEVRATIRIELWLSIGLLVVLGASVATEFVQGTQPAKHALLVIDVILARRSSASR